MENCEFCGAKFGDYKCYFCEKNCCTSCMIDDRSRCKNCFMLKKRVSWQKLLKRNKILLGFIAFIWFYAVFPGPIFPDMPSTYYTASLMAAILFMIPVGLMLFFWSLNPPRSDIKKR